MKHFWGTFCFLFISNFVFGQLYITNNTKYTVHIALAYHYTYSDWSGWKTKGWYKIEPGDRLQAFSLADINYDKNLSTNIYYCVSKVGDDTWRGEETASFIVDKDNAFEIYSANKEATLSKNSNYIWKKFHKIDASVKLLQFTVNAYINEIAACTSGDCEDGTGTYAWVYAGKKYSGQWRNGVRSGQGKCIYYENNINHPGCVYEGRWLNDEWTIGTLQYPDGQKYVGSFTNYKAQGQGTLYDSKGKVLKKGTWEAGKLIQSENDNNSDPDPAERPKVWAVIVGVKQYSNPDNNNLNYCDKDAQQVYDFMRSPQGGGVPSQQLKLLKNTSATRANILAAAESIYKQADKSDLVLFFFSGHGGPNYFLAHDRQLQHADLKNIIDRCDAGKKLCVADACYAGTWSKEAVNQSKSSDADLERLYYNSLADSDNGLALFMSSRSNETSLEDSYNQQGLFTYYYLKGLKGAADTDYNKIITVEELYDYVKDGVSKRASNTFDHSQHPQLKGTFDHDMPVGVRR